MKKIYFALLSVALLFSACEKFLEEENRSNVTAEEFYVTEGGFTALINANYAQLREIYGGDPWVFCAGTDLYAEGRSPEPFGISRYTLLTSATEEIADLYNNCYAAIQTANMGLYYSEIAEGVNNMDQYVGELKYLRANAYFLLVQTYGGVGIVTDYIQTPVLEFDRNSAEDVYALIISDLEEAVEVVADGTFTGRVNKRSVEHLLAKVYLTKGYESFGTSADFTSAASYADAAINGQSLDLSFEELWTPGNELNEEVLFSVQFSKASQSSDPENLGHKQNYFFGPYMGGSDVVGVPYRSYNLCPTDYALSLFENGDTRWTATFMTEVQTQYLNYYSDGDAMPIKEYYAASWASTEADTTAYRINNPNTKIHMYGSYGAGIVSGDWETIPVKKFDDPEAPFTNRSASTRDLILSRVGETYLIAAEAYLQAGQAATGLNRLNEVRRRAGVANASIGEFDIDYILEERARELLGEYHRWFDLKRTGTLVERAVAHHYLIDSEANFAGANGELKILRPIPQEALDLNQNKNFPQNPAYN